jgi:hypothetical protein
VRDNAPASQPGRETLKSYNAERNELNLLDQNQAEGSNVSYAYQGFYNFYIINDLVTYNTQWYSYDANGEVYDLGSKVATVRGVQPTGQNKKDYQSFPAAGLGYIQAALSEPQEVYYAASSYKDNKTTYYQFDGQSVASSSTITNEDFNKPYPTYLISPSSDQAFWSEIRDGKNALFIGDGSAAKKKQLALGDFAPYGWYSDSYLLVSKNSSELYIMPASGLKSSQQPTKVTDYYKPVQTYAGYGYGYGGL